MYVCMSWLACFQRVLAVELNQHLCAAAEENCARNNVRNARVVACDSEKFASIVLRNRSYVDRAVPDHPYFFHTVVVDPPRCGLDGKTRRMLSAYASVIYISCNPQALLRDLDEVWLYICTLTYVCM